MKAIVLDVPSPVIGTDNPVTRFCDNPGIRVHAVQVIPPYVHTRISYRDESGYISHDDSRDARILVTYETLTDADAIERAVKYEQIALKRLARIAKEVEQKPGFTKLRNATEREIYLLTFHGVSKAEAAIVAELARMPAAVEKLLEESA